MGRPWELTQNLAYLVEEGVPLPVGRLAVPERVETDGDRLMYWWPERHDDGDEALGDLIRPPGDLISRFMRLASADAEAIRFFAARFGPLRLCERHSLPITHNSAGLSQGTDRTLQDAKEQERPPWAAGIGEPVWSLIEEWCRQQSFCLPAGWQDLKNGGSFWEPVKAWRRFATEAQAILRLAVRLHSTRPIEGESDDWGSVRSSWARIGEEASTSSAQRKALAGVLTEWLELGDVRPWVEWKPEPRLLLTFGDLFGVLALQLVAMATMSRGAAVCSGCGVMYLPKRQPNPTRRSYCPDCRENRVPQRDAERAYRRRKAEGDA